MFHEFTNRLRGPIYVFNFLLLQNHKPIGSKNPITLFFEGITNLNSNDILAIDTILHKINLWLSINLCFGNVYNCLVCSPSKSCTLKQRNKQNSWWIWTIIKFSYWIFSLDSWKGVICFLCILYLVLAGFFLFTLTFSKIMFFSNMILTGC